jgi:hypothetical protein
MCNDICRWKPWLETCAMTCTCLKPGLPSTYVIAHVSSQGFHLHMSLHMSQARTSIYICHCTCLKPGLPSTYVIAHVSSQDFHLHMSLHMSQDRASIYICHFTWKSWLETCAMTYVDGSPGLRHVQ